MTECRRAWDTLTVSLEVYGIAFWLRIKHRFIED